MVERIKKANSKSAGGWFKQSVIEGLVDVKDLKKGVPEYARAMMKELSKPKNQEMIKDMVREKADEVLQKTYAHVDDRQRQEQIERIGAVNAEDAKDKLHKKIHHNRELLNVYAMIIIALSSLLFAIEGFSKGSLRQSQYIMLVICLFALVAVGVTTPMIDIEAKISHLGFTLLDHPIAFENQVVFFQSKSILDVFHIMITHKDPLMKAVGVLIVCFSVIFPLCKLTSSLAFYYDYCRARSKRLIKFFVLHSGKWSMAVVLVVGIFMAYIGFNGIINSQLDNIKESGKNLDLLTTNGTQLQPGYFVFMTYAILALFLSSFLSSRPCYKDTSSENPDLG
jgi:nitrate reductase NapE component